ncbi:phosphotransferase family protein [Spirosoma pollinicola]|uniref:Aminoglycoside phosphotransferase domain-containing protein n=1 Tax=Spirosoma pollinicola TaxID=2057025 RepID=A0A2K8Z8C0_9BACT|nr:phosphotransferase [Spirosoma pollinicola]AUD06122.1 hypothetical protein CWM47_32325 [Spirosoma pollinicola]
MMFLLNTYHLSHYLIGLSHHLLGQNGVGVIPTTMRNINSDPYMIFSAEWPDGKKWFIKQPLQFRINERVSIVNEANVTNQINQIALIRCYAPGYIYSDPVNKILITDYFPDSINLSQKSSIPLSQLLTSSNLVEKTAKIIASFHVHLTKAAKVSVNDSHFYFFKPPFLVDNIAFLNPFLKNEHISFIKRKWLASLILQSQVSDTLLELNQSWRPDFIIHGDATFDNILVHLNGKSIEKIKLCDWEFAGWGDVDWDAAGFFQGLLQAYMDMRINHAILLEAGRRYYNTYISINQFIKFDSFDNWFVKILRLSAVNFLERLLGSSMKIITNTDQSRRLDDRVEFLLTRVLTNPHLLKSF